MYRQSHQRVAVSIRMQINEFEQSGSGYQFSTSSTKVRGYAYIYFRL